MSFFWNGYILRDFIFLNFNTHTVPGFIGVFVALFSVGILYEGLFYLKKDLLQKFLLAKSTPQTNRLNAPFEALEPSESDDTTETGVVGPGGDASNPRHSLLAGEDLPDVVTGGAVPSDVGVEGGGVPIRRRISSTTQLFNLGDNHTTLLFISSILHACYAFIGYTLMNAVMTFNIWVMVSIVTGIGVGYFFFRTEGTPGCQRNLRGSSSSSAQPFRNAIETDEDDGEGGYGGNLHQRSPSTRSSSSTKNKTDNNPTSPGGGSGSRGSRTPSSSGGGRKSRNRMMEADAKGGPEESPLNSQCPDPPPPPGGGGGGGNGGEVGPAAQVIVVGAQVHNNYQQSV